MLKHKNLLYFTAAAAASSSAQALLTSPVLQQRTVHSSMLATPSRINNRDILADNPRNQATRLYFSSQKEQDEGFLSKLGKAAKSVLPTKWFGTDEEKAKLQRRKEVRDEISGGLNEILKDAPLPIKMVGKMMGPLMGKMASSLAETVAEQQRTTEGLLEDARGYLMNDPAVTGALGEPISVGSPFSQSSSTSSINGKTQVRFMQSVKVC